LLVFEMGADLKRSALGAPGSIRIGNKAKRQSLYIRHKQGWAKERREQRFARKKEEKNDPELRRQRLATNRPITIDDKRIWDDGDDDHLGAVVDVVRLKRRKLEEGYEPTGTANVDQELELLAKGDDDVDSMLDSEEEMDGAVAGTAALGNLRADQRDTSLAPSIAPSTTSTNLELTPESLALKFPTLFTEDAPPQPKILMTTSINSHIHREAEILCGLFPNTTYIRRSAHRYGHKYSIREISKFATNRDYTAVIVLKEDQKELTGLTIIHLPAGPSFSFSISSWIEGKKLPGHGNATNHYPELLLNGFHTPLGILTARMFQRLFVPQPEIQGRQVVRHVSV
jgi:ribosome production factor 1